jgi:hypothetical protein
MGMNMFEQLKAIFPSLIQGKPNENLDVQNYQWFKTEESDVVGIKRKEISANELALLKTFLEPYQVEHFPVTKKEHDWIDILFHNSNKGIKSNRLTSFRFIYFSLSEKSVDPMAFREAIHGIYPRRAPIIWENDQEGVIIEENCDKNEEFISYEQMVNVLMSDFYIKIYFYISPILTDIKHAASAYKWGKQSFIKVLRYNNKPVSTYVEAIPYLLVDLVDEDTRNKITTSILQETLTDKELLKTIRVFLECGSNATLAAKKLYMHRNSLQYRVDKFTDKTGIDIKNFDHALTVYLTLMLTNQL